MPHPHRALRGFLDEWARAAADGPAPAPSEEALAKIQGKVRRRWGGERSGDGGVALIGGGVCRGRPLAMDALPICYK